MLISHLSCMPYRLVSLVIVSFFLLRRMTAYAVEYIPFLIFLAALLLFWSTEMGKTDIVVAVILVAMGLAVVNGQIVLASALLVVGVLVHEVSAIYGLPLLAALLIDDGRYRQFKWRSFAWSAAVLAAGAILYEATMLLPHSSNSAIVATIESEIRSTQLDQSLVPQAFYFHLGGARAVKTAMCTVESSKSYYPTLDHSRDDRGSNILFVRNASRQMDPADIC